MPSKSSTTEGPSPLPERVNVGLILRPHGIAGELQVEPWSEHPARFAPGASLLAVPPGKGVPRILRVERASPHRGGLRVAFAGVADRDAAQALRGWRLEIARSEVPEAPRGSYYVFELVGCRCHDQRFGELGEVTDLASQGGGWLVEVERADGRRLSLPFVEEFLVEIDREGRRIEWRLPEGLIEACAYES